MDPADRSRDRTSVLFRYPERQPSPADEADFEAAMGAHGRRFDISAASVEVQDTVLDLRWRAKLLLDTIFDPAKGGPLPAQRMLFDFLDGPDPNACIQHDAGAKLCCVGITLPLVRRLYQSAYAYLSLPGLFADVGVPALETASEPEAGRVIFRPSSSLPGETTLPLSAPFPSAVFAELVPMDSGRHYFAHVLVGMVLQWLFYHEFYHAWAGHLAFAREVTGRTLFSYSEAADTSAGSVLPLGLSHLIEYDADKRASRRIVAEVLDGGLMLNALKDDQTTVEQRIQGWSLMLVTLFEILRPAKAVSEVRASGSHPHNDVRLWGVYQSFKDLLPAALTEIYDRSIQQSFRTVRSLRQAAGLSDDSYSASRDRTSEVIDECNRLNAEVVRVLYPRTRSVDMDQINAARSDQG